MKSHSSTTSRGQRQAGFALVASLSIMAILVLIAVALYSLSSVATKSAEVAAAKVEAEANARMALMQAIGKLQKYTGADTRITAPANLLEDPTIDLETVDDNIPKLVGAWRSWEGLNHDATGRPVTPDYTVKESAHDLTDPSDTNRFLTWLVSSATEGDDLNTPETLAYLTETTINGETTIPLLTAGDPNIDTDGSLRDADAGNSVPTPREIHVIPTEPEDGGRYAWWISPENQKARLSQPHAPRTETSEALVEMGQSHTVPDPEVFGFNDQNSSPESYNRDTSVGPLSRSLSRETLSLIDSSNTSQPHKSFHDLSSSATGLLTNTATGGWRKDLSLLTERWDDIYNSYPGGELPLFRYSPTAGATSSVPLPTTSDYDPEQSNLYPWSEYSTIIGNDGDEQPNIYHAASASWQSLQNFATTYKNLTFSGGSATSPFVWDRISDQNNNLGGQQMYNYKHQQRLYSQIARFQLMVYANAIVDPDEADPDRRELWIKYVPFLTLWNPYNITLELDVNGTLGAGQGSGQHPNFRGFGWRRSLPGAMAITRQAPGGGFGSNNFQLLNNGNMQFLDISGNHGGRNDERILSNATKFGDGTRAQYFMDARTWGLWLPEGTLTFAPGEVKLLSPDFIDPGYGFGGTAMRMKEGFDPTDVVGPERRVQNNRPRSEVYRFLFRPDRLTQPFDGRPPGAGFSLSFGDGGSHFGGTSQVPSGIGDEYHNITALANEAQASAYWPPDEVDEVDYSLGALEGRWTPLFSVSFGPRITLGTGSGQEQNRPTKGVVQNDALVAMALSDPGSGVAKDHPVNNTFDFAYHSTPGNSNVPPGESTSAGYIGTGYQSPTGLSRLIMVDLPLRPIASLVELQGWNPRGSNPYPPFQMNLIGNSDATPLIPSESIAPTTLAPDSVEENLMHDDAYCANHLLFDDWFASSIAPQPDLSGNGEDINEVYEEFLEGNSQLSNRAYRPIEEDRDLSSSDAASLANDILNTSVADSWLKVASRFEVEGMFNVNSTSVEAWEALLGHAKNREEIALYGASDFEATTPSGEHPVTRGTAAYDEEAGSDSVIGADDTFTIANEYLGFRSLDDVQIRDLAEKIVEQVRLRGPFLSLAEFINRKLTDDASEEDLALAGALQTALNNLTNDPMATLRNPSNNLSSKTMSDPETDVLDVSTKLDGSDYEFSEAAAGDSAYGAPGWVRQADILRPIAPVLSARDDTFTIRAYGDKLDQNGNTIARAWCEAVVKRTRNFCDSSDSADSIEPPSSPTNIAFGRRYEIVSFRWLAPEEV